MNDASPPRALPLAMVEENATVRVVAIQGGDSLARRVTDIGLRLGSEVTVRGRQGGGLVVASGEARYALGGGMAHRILVCPIEPAPAGGGTCCRD